MTALKLTAIAADLLKQGKTNEEIRKALFNTKGARVSQINKIMDLLA